MAGFLNTPVGLGANELLSHMRQRAVEGWRTNRSRAQGSGDRKVPWVWMELLLKTIFGDMAALWAGWSFLPCCSGQWVVASPGPRPSVACYGTSSVVKLSRPTRPENRCIEGAGPAAAPCLRPQQALGERWGSRLQVCGTGRLIPVPSPSAPDQWPQVEMPDSAPCPLCLVLIKGVLSSTWQRPLEWFAP